MMKSMMNRKKAAIAILARDCEKTLPVFLKKIECLREQFESSRIVIVENNSKDKTKSLLEEYRASHADVMLHMFDDPAVDTLPRIEKMALLRNKCLEIVRESNYDPDFYIVIDGDLDFDVPSISRAIQYVPADWAALFANGRYYLKAGSFRIPVLYYDLFAYLPEERQSGDRDSLTETEMLRIRPLTQRALRKKRYLKCRSAFGGVGIYRYEAVGENCYAVENNTVSSKFDHLCEHIPFNRGVSKNGTLYICRDLKAYYEPISIKTWLYCLIVDNIGYDKRQNIKLLYYKLFPRRRKTDKGAK